MATRKRKLIKVTLVLSVAPGVTKAQAKREVRTRVNEECCYILDNEDVRVRKAS
ncbi:MAG: hypothetical protein KKA05_10410 [Alphaproteobacteria bacterium]|nr:hypothetical protein [Alphaproteobacteria bacterium]